MAIQLTIIGLGQIGASIGLALSDQVERVRRVGHDQDMRIARRAEKMGAVDHVETRLSNSVRQADLVMLSLPVDQIQETLHEIAPDLKEGAVVMDTGLIKEKVAEWAKEELPPGRNYVGLTPVISPAYLHNVESGVDAARKDLFRGGLIAIGAPPGTDSGAIKLAADLTQLLGSTPLFTDPVEIDGLMAATHVLPQLLAAALLNATVDQPGWREGRKVAGRAYAEATGPIVHLGLAPSLKASALLNRDNVLRVLDTAIAALRALRNDIDVHDEQALEKRLERARYGREVWWRERNEGNWANQETPPVPLPDKSSMLQKLFGSGWKPREKEEKP